MVEMAACVVGRVRDCVRWILTKDIIAVVGIELWMSPCSFVSGIWEEYALSPLRWTRGELRASVSRAGLRSDRHSQFWGDIKLCLCEAC